MSWGTAWRNSWSGTWGDGISLTVAETVHAVTSDLVSTTQFQTLSVAETVTVLSSDNAVLAQANNLVVADARNNHYVDSISLTQLASLLINNTRHNNYVYEIGYFIIPELRLNGTLFGNSGAITVSNVQCAVFADGDIPLSPILQTSSIAINGGQIAVQHSNFRYEDIGSGYLVILYKPGTPRIGGGPYPAIMVDANA